MENTTHLSTCPIIMGVESYLSEYIGTRGCLDDWNIWKMAEVVHYPNYALTSCAVLVVSSITIDMLLSNVTGVQCQKVTYRHRYVASTRICIIVSRWSVSFACSTKQLTSTVGFVFVVKPALPLEVIPCL